MKTRLLTVAAMTLIFLTAPFGVQPCLAQEPSQQAEQQQPGYGQRQVADDSIRQLNLTAEQQEQLRAIRLQLQDERAIINRRVRETNRALEEALESDNPDEALIEQRLRDLSGAQAAQMRMRVLSEMRIRRVLTPEQRTLLRELRQAKQFLRARPLENQRRRQNGLDGARRLRNQRNILGPAGPRTEDPRGRARP